MFSRWYTGIGLFLLLPSQILAQDCSADSPCDQGCCNKEGYCGFGPDFCGKDVCVSTCDAVAECGGQFSFVYIDTEYAPEGKEACPLNVCCSEFGQAFAELPKNSVAPAAKKDATQ
ncbi:chitinase [Aspergillus sclerotialis]|uniref:Chitinase n=1 Tax=Aspergillus sclerotialis TaxID=2070753 RepID=A0A3A2ZN10_9EURO|nr:chitinase [Aspergillus sclerotialis]